MDRPNIVKRNEATIVDEDDAGSNYGSDFTPDEEEILNALLSRISADTPHGATKYDEKQPVLGRRQFADSTVVFEMRQHKSTESSGCDSISDHSSTWNGMSVE